MAAYDLEPLWNAQRQDINGVDMSPLDSSILQPFKEWVSCIEMASNGFTLHDHIWTKILISERWIVISGTPFNITRSKELERPKSMKLSETTSKSQTFDWTEQQPPLKITPHIVWARSMNWAATPLGPMVSWSPQLRSIANLVMQDPRPAVVFYGPELIMIYNEAEIELLGGFHPCMGKSARVALASVWPEHFEPIITANLAGETIEKTNAAIHMVRNGFMEETYFSLKFIPIFDARGATIGHYESLIETTRDVISQRRSRILLELSEEIPRARDTASFWDCAIEVLSRNDKDIPFALLYATDADDIDSTSSWPRFSDDQQQCTLRGSFGLPKESRAGPKHLEFHEHEGFTPHFRRAMAARKPIVISLEDSSVFGDLTDNMDRRGWGDPCRSAAICPLNPTSSQDNILGFMVIGLNPRRPYDSDYYQFLLVTSQLLSTSLISLLLHEEDITRRERAIASAEAMKLTLRQQLHESQKESARNMLKFQRFAERSDIGIFILDMSGIYSYRNEAWFDIFTPEDRDVALAEAWNALIDDEHIDRGQSKFEDLMETKQHQSFELRLKRFWEAPIQNFDESIPQKQPKWVLCSIFPEVTDAGEVVEIIGCCTDISQQKYGELLQATQASSAQKSKRQLENFIDTTSHEMRNPLSAIVQCADSIISMHNEFSDSKDNQIGYQKIIETTIDAAETIVQCSKHMKTIVDDVLTMSKLDSGLFAMTPVDVRLESIARNAVKMFEGEARSADVRLNFRLEDSCKDIDVDIVSVDPTRVLQILINLITNAIKFTRLEDRRAISVSLGVSFEVPARNADGRVSFLRQSEATEADTLQADWKKGQVVYVIFSVEDTGRGLSDAEHQLLFARFSQASPRTHIDYGGSGLGLYISRRLTEMHGGAIGFASKPGIGSTFSFYVKARRSQPPPSSKAINAAAELSIRTQASMLGSRSRDQNDEAPSIEPNLAKKEVPLTELHVLVVEDNLVNQRVLAKQLRNIGMKVAVANHGGEALEHLYRTKFCSTEHSAMNLSLILMDWEMPVMDGLTCVRNIRQLQKEGRVYKHVPVIAVTANVRTEQVQVALKAGMDNVISKPFRIPELCACIQSTLLNAKSS
ncbi:hypothetical protein ACN47E_005211 [Coniothyrium glycines]